MTDVVALGELLIDFAAKSADASGYPTMAANPGGAPGNFLAALGVYGCKTAFIGKVGARIMSLQNPNQKMSKSDPNPKASVSILDEPSVIMKKFKSAVTDSEAVVRYGEGKDGINNLMAIYSCCTGASFDEIEREFEGKGYGDFKTKVGEAVIEELTPVRENFNRIVNDKAYLSECMAKGAETAQRISERTLNKVMKKVGFLLK